MVSTNGHCRSKSSAPSAGPTLPAGIFIPKQRLAELEHTVAEGAPGAPGGLGARAGREVRPWPGSLPRRIHGPVRWAIMRIFSSLITLSLGVLLAGCGDSSSEPQPRGHVRPHGGDEPFVFPPIGYTGTDGMTSFRVPFSTNLKDVTWSVGDPLVAEIRTANAPPTYSAFGDSWGLVDVLGPGTTTITATSGDKSATAMLVVTQYTAAQVSAGRTRYYEPADPGGARQACNDCHGGVQGADHSPLEMAFFPDDQVLEAIVDGKYDDGYVLQGVDHRWNLTDEERTAIVPFLRSLAPTGIF
jgi:hypothetical protein